MKIDTKTLKIYLRIYASVFAASLGTFWHDHSMPVLQKIGYAAVIALVVMPLIHPISVILVRLLGIEIPKANEVKPPTPRP